MNENQDGMNPEDFSEFLREFLSKQNGIDAEALAKAAGIPNDPKALEQMLKNPDEGTGTLDGMINGFANKVADALIAERDEESDEA